MISKPLLTVLFVVVFSATAWAQNKRTATGKVTEAEEGLPLPQVSVLLKGTITGLLTDADGNYTITVPDEGGTLRFRYLGVCQSGN